VVPVDYWQPEQNRGWLWLWEHVVDPRGRSGSMEQNDRAGEISEGKGTRDNVASSGGAARWSGVARSPPRGRHGGPQHLVDERD
jgi:hypothetical protein